MQEMLETSYWERLAEKAGITMSQALRDAGLAPSIYSRWKARRTTPSMRTVSKLSDAIEAARLKKSSARSTSTPERTPTPEGADA